MLNAHIVFTHIISFEQAVITGVIAFSLLMSAMNTKYPYNKLCISFFIYSYVHDVNVREWVRIYFIHYH